MKKILHTTLLSAILTSTLMSETVFDLGAQQFYNSVTPEKHYQDASYDLGTSFASTGLAFIDGGYKPKGGRSGSLKAQVKNPKLHWGVSFSMYCYIFADGCGISLVGSNGNAINIHLDNRRLRVNGEEINGNVTFDGSNVSSYSFYQETTVDGVIDGYDDNISVVVNGHKFNFMMPNFKLAHVELNVASDGTTGGNPKSIDSINGLVITSSE